MIVRECVLIVCCATTIVKQAKQLSGVWIVDYNWLEDSLQKRRKLAEKKYTWEVLRKQRRLAKTMKRVGTVSDTKKFRDGCAKALEDTGTDLYHVYTDVTGFSHDLSFTRHNPILNTTAKYDLRLYESNTKPHVYCTFIRYIPPSDALNKASTTINNPQAQTSSESEAARLQALVNSPTQVPNISELPQSPTSDKLYKTVLSPPNSPFDKSFQTFRHAFQDLTLLPWEERSPSGTFPLLPAPIQNAGNGYARNSFSPPLPALEAPLSPSSGAIGSAIAREEHERARREEEVKNQERERMRLANREKARERERLRAKGRAALFNGVNGPPVRTPLGNPPSLARSSSALPPSNRAASLAAGEERYGRGASMGASSWTPMAYGAGSRSPGAAGGLMRPPDGLAPRLNPAVFTQFPKVGKRTTKFWDER
ncbi:unnamed protein product [Periconia digitata]|uniref:BRCT domain-containing protein n=1 Tax=Periconia digitata TaxID=1303443 RepID=A0A9W4UAK3_9PLEO|nr:unnamed protein product [Periconia digitata]